MMIWISERMLQRGRHQQNNQIHNMCTTQNTTPLAIHTVKRQIIDTCSDRQRWSTCDLHPFQNSLQCVYTVPINIDLLHVMCNIIRGVPGIKFHYFVESE